MPLNTLWVSSSLCVKWRLPLIMSKVSFSCNVKVWWGRRLKSVWAGWGGEEGQGSPVSDCRPPQDWHPSFYCTPSGRYRPFPSISWSPIFCSFPAKTGNIKCLLQPKQLELLRPWQWTGQTSCPLPDPLQTWPTQGPGTEQVNAEENCKTCQVLWR